MQKENVLDTSPKLHGSGTPKDPYTYGTNLFHEGPIIEEAARISHQEAKSGQVYFKFYGGIISVSQAKTERNDNLFIARVNLNNKAAQYDIDRLTIYATYITSAFTLEAIKAEIMSQVFKD